LKLDPTRAANALAIVGAGLYVVCTLLVVSTPVFYRGVAQTWMHGFNLSALPMRQMTFGGSVYGLVTFTVVSWLTGYAFAAVYNALGKK